MHLCRSSANTCAGECILKPVAGAKRPPNVVWTLSSVTTKRSPPDSKSSVSKESATWRSPESETGKWQCTPVSAQTFRFSASTIVQRSMSVPGNVGCILNWEWTIIRLLSGKKSGSVWGTSPQGSRGTVMPRRAPVPGLNFRVSGAEKDA